MSKCRLLVIGLDGAWLGLLRAWAPAMPFLSGLMAKGVSGPLQSTIPPVTSPAWGTFMTGKNPGSHGVFHHMGNPFSVAGTGQSRTVPASGAQLDAARIWTVLNRHGWKVGVVDLPLILQPEPLDGFMVCNLSNWGREKGLTYPAALRDQLLRESGIVFGGSILDGMAATAPYLERLTQAVRTKGNLDAYLLSHQDCDAFVTVYEHTDTLQHVFWPALESEMQCRALSGGGSWQESGERPTQRPAWDGGSELGPLFWAFFRSLDEAVESAVRAAGEGATVFLLSDHGFGAAETEVAVNELLLKAGLLALRKGNALPLALNRLGISYGSLKYVYRKLGLASLLGRRAETVRRAQGVVNRATSYAIDLDVSVAVAEREGIYLRAGRLNYQELRAQVMAAIEGLRDPESGLTPLAGVYRREDVYSGRHLEQAPDIVLLARDGFKLVSRLQGKQVVYRAGKSGGHYFEGFFAAWGPNIVSDGRQAGDIQGVPALQDVAPTLLYAMGLPVPNDMDGHVLDYLFTPEHRRNSPREEQAPAFSLAGLYEDGESIAAQQEIMKRLAGLGYLE